MGGRASGRVDRHRRCRLGDQARARCAALVTPRRRRAAMVARALSAAAAASPYDDRPTDCSKAASAAGGSSSSPFPHTPCVVVGVCLSRVTFIV